MGDQDSRLRLTSSNKKKVSGSHEESEANIAQKGTYYFAQWIDKQIVFTKLLYFILLDFSHPKDNNLIETSGFISDMHTQKKRQECNCFLTYSSQLSNV